MHSHIMEEANTHHGQQQQNEELKQVPLSPASPRMRKQHSDSSIQGMFASSAPSTPKDDLREPPAKALSWSDGSAPSNEDPGLWEHGGGFEFGSFWGGS